MALAFLAAAYPVSEAQHHPTLVSAKTLGMALSVSGIIAVTLGTAMAVFTVIPQGHRVANAAPLPSRLDLTIGRPIAPLDIPPGESVPLSQFLPSRDSGSETPGAQGGSAPDTGPVESTGPGGLSQNGGAPLVEQQSYVTLGYTGDQDLDVVMYVRSPLASYWRGMVLEEYDGRGWKPDRSRSLLEVDRWGRLRFEDAPPRTGGVSSYVQSYFPRVDQPEAVFTGYTPGYTPGYIALRDAASEGSLRARAIENVRRLHEAGSYRVVSAVPNLRPGPLLLDTADRGYLPSLNPPSVPQRVRALSEAIVEGSTSDFQMAARLEQYLLTYYNYDLRVAPLSRSGDVVDSFLFERKAGYCAQFATAMAVMARLVGLPARVATGYVPGRYKTA